MKKFILPQVIAVFIFFSFSLTTFAQDILLGGQNIGIVLNYKHVYVADTYKINNIENENLNNIKIGDAITEINGIKVNTVNEIFEQLKNIIGNETNADIKIIRNDNVIDTKLNLYFNSKNNSYQTGLIVKDNISGIGTATFYFPKTKAFALLGHNLQDSNINKKIEIQNGLVYLAPVLNFRKSKNGIVGDKIAKIDYENKIGMVKKSNQFGVYGYYDHLPENVKNSLEIANIDEINLGKAYILTVLNDNQVEKFEIEIIKLDKKNIDQEKTIVFKITDKKLLKKTNGIIQGMSGSPIVQNDKLIGAITHVMVNDVKSGYGIYAQKMLEEIEKMEKEE